MTDTPATDSRPQVLFRVDGATLEKLDARRKREGFKSRNDWFNAQVVAYLGARKK